MTNRTLTAILAAAIVCALPARGDAMCGCEKPAPAAAAVRPNVAYPAQDLFSPCDLTKGGCVALFSDAFVAGQTYRAEFRSLTGHRRRVDVLAQQRRDLADGAWRAQLWVPVPPKSPLGPASIEVRDGAGALLLAVPDTDFTVVAPPIVVPADGGVVMVDKYQGAVGRDGTLYVAFDVTGMLPRIDFAAKGYGLPLRYGKDDMLIYNAQGVLMEALNPMVVDEDLNDDGDYHDAGEGDWNGNGLVDNPDISEIVPEAGGDTDAFLYSRHPFDLYETNHQPGGALALDPTDTNWHADGSRHTDNFHFVVAIGNATLDGEPLRPGGTQRFTLALDAAVNESAGQGN